MACPSLMAEPPCPLLPTQERWCQEGQAGREEAFWLESPSKESLEYPLGRRYSWPS